jgi:GntR family transcriptional regulator
VENIVRKDIPVPIYYQISEYFRELISQVELKPGDKLPPEQELCEIFKVSRMTVRKALDILARDGLVSRENGKGTFVQKKRYVENLLMVTSFDNTIKSQDSLASAKLLEIQKVPANEQLAKKLKIQPDTEVYQIARIRYADSTPIGLQTYYLPVAFCRGLHEQDLTQSIQALLTEKYGYQFVKVQTWFEAVPANEFQANCLEVSEKFPLLKKRVILFHSDGRPIEYLRVLYRSDLYNFFIETVAQSAIDYSYDY